MLRKRTTGFTIIEVLIVLTIAGTIMATVFLVIPKVREQQRKNQARNEVNSLMSSIVVAQQYYRKPLRLITGNNCSDCACRPPALMTDAACVNNWLIAKNAISSAGLDISDLVSDPWGAPYALDENEGEAGLPACTPDNIRSVGPDGTLNTTDDISRSVPLRTPC